MTVEIRDVKFHDGTHPMLRFDVVLFEADNEVITLHGVRWYADVGIAAPVFVMKSGGRWRHWTAGRRLADAVGGLLEKHPAWRKITPAARGVDV